jgi:hypothetical protein
MVVVGITTQRIYDLMGLGLRIDSDGRGERRRPQAVERKQSDAVRAGTARGAVDSGCDARGVGVRWDCVGQADFV